MKVFNLGIFPKRYFLVDFKFAKMTIYKNKNDPKSAKIVLFRDIKNCYCLDWQGNMMKEWTYSFFLQTTERNYVLIAATPMEKQVWLDAFSYIIPSTQILQDIIRQNEEDYNEY